MIEVAHTKQGDKVHYAPKHYRDQGKHENGIVKDFRVDVEVVPIALTMDQIEEHQPPPNPAKVKDPRSTGYIDTFGAVSWELDALPPKALNRLVEREMMHRIDVDLFEKRVKKEEEDKNRLTELIKGFKSKEE